MSFAGLAVGEQEAKRLILELIQLGKSDERLRELFHPYLDGIDFDPLRELNFAKQFSDDALELLADLPRLAGSNAWAVAPSRRRHRPRAARFRPAPRSEPLAGDLVRGGAALAWRDGGQSTRWARRCPVAR